MLDLFILWARQISRRPVGQDIEMRLTVSEPSANPSARLDIDAPTMVARVTCWESGDYDAEVIDVMTEETLFSSHGEFQAGRPVSERLSAFFEALGIKLD